MAEYFLNTICVAFGDGMEHDMKRIFLVVLDSVGVGELPDANLYGDVGSNTLYAASTSSYFHMPNMQSLGLFHIDGVREKFNIGPDVSYEGCVGRLAEKSKGKDTTTGHWEIAGLIMDRPFPTYPQGFPDDIIKSFERETGRKVLCNLPYSGTDVIRDYGKEHVETGALIVYTSADSVFQIAAHEEVIPLTELYRYCEIARRLLTGQHGVGRVIARPFLGTFPDYKRTVNRHDFSLVPPEPTMLDLLKEAGRQTLAVGKIYDIFAEKGITDTVRTHDNAEGIEKLIERMKWEFEGLCFVNLVDFDMIYGHRNDVDGYAKALTSFDEKLPDILAGLREEDILMITADHGCDPLTPSTDHSREYIPLVIYGDSVKKGFNLGTRQTYADIAATVLDYFGVDNKTAGTSFLPEIIK